MQLNSLLQFRWSSGARLYLICVPAVAIWHSSKSSETWGLWPMKAAAAVQIARLSFHSEPRRHSKFSQDTSSSFRIMSGLFFSSCATCLFPLYGICPLTSLFPDPGSASSNLRKAPRAVLPSRTTNHRARPAGQRSHLPVSSRTDHSTGHHLLIFAASMACLCRARSAQCLAELAHCIQRASQGLVQ